MWTPENVPFASSDLTSDSMAAVALSVKSFNGRVTVISDQSPLIPSFCAGIGSLSATKLSRSGAFLILVDFSRNSTGALGTYVRTYVLRW